MKKIKNLLTVLCIFISIIIITLIISPENIVKKAIKEFTILSETRLYVNDFEKYENDFNIIKDKMLQYINIAEETNLHDFWIEFNNGVICCKYNKKFIDLNEKETEALNNISTKAFRCKDAQLSKITVYKNRIAFNTEGNLYALVFSADDKKPQFICFPDESLKIKIKKIKDNWYHVVNNPE